MDKKGINIFVKGNNGNFVPSISDDRAEIGVLQILPDENPLTFSYGGGGVV